MTATSPTPPRPRARRFARVLAAGAAAAVAAASLLFATPATAATTPSPSATQLSGKAVLTLSPVGRGVVQPDAGLSAYVTLDNGTATELNGGTVTIAAGSAPLADRAALAAWLSGTHSGVQLEDVTTGTMAPVASGASTPVLVEVPAAQTQRAPGVYPLLATVSGPDGSMTAASVMIVPDPAQPQATVGVVVPITAGAMSTGLLTSEQLATMTAADGALTTQLDAVAGTGAILAVDPAIPAAIRVLGSAAPATATAWLERLMTLSNPRFALQFGDADIAAQVNAGRATLVTPLDLSSYLDAANFAQEDSGATPTPAPSPSRLPDLSALTDIGTAAEHMYWPFSRTADTKILGTLTTADRSALTLVASASTTGGANNATVTARTTIGDAQTLVYDSAISSALGEAAVTPDQQHRGSDLAEATANLVFAAKDAGTAPLLVTIDRPGLPDGGGLRAAIETALDGALNAGITTLTSAPTNPVTFGTTDPDAARTAAFTSMQTDEQALHDFSSVLDDPAVLTGPERAQIMQLIGGAWLPDAESWTAAVSAHRAKSAKTLDSVRVLAPSELLIVSSGADLRFWVRNDLPWPVNVTLHAAPDSPKLVVQPTTDVRGSASSNTRAVVPVKARVGNGEVSISLSLKSPTGVAIGSPQVADVNVRADWEAFGITGLAVLVGGFLVIGVIRMLRRRKRQQGEDDGSPEGDGAPGGDEHTAIAVEMTSDHAVDVVPSEADQTDSPLTPSPGDDSPSGDANDSADASGDETGEPVSEPGPASEENDT